MPRKSQGAKKTVTERFEVLVRDLVAELKKHYGARLVSAVVFGSVGRGSPRPDSDVDVLVVAEPLPDGRMPRVRDFGAVKNALAARLASLAGEGIHTTLAPIFKTPAEVRRGSLLFLDIIDDGRVLFDRSGFWRDFIQDFQERLRRLGGSKDHHGRSLVLGPEAGLQGGRDLRDMTNSSLAVSYLKKATDRLAILRVLQHKKAYS